MAGSPKKKTAAAKGKTKTKASKATPPVSARPSLVDTPSADFEAGLLFERFGAGNMGRLDALSFQKMWREREKLQQLRKALVPPNSARPGSLPPGVSSGVPPLYAVAPSGEGAGVPMSFEAGQLFERYDHDHDGRLTRPEFEGLLNDYLRSKQQQPPPSNHTTTANNTPPAQPAPLPPPPQPLPPAEPPLAPRALPSEVTHYNESTGVPLPADVVLRYQSAYGHKVLPIAQAFERRMHTLQGLLTSHVLPRREQLVQLGRRVKVVEEEVRGARLAIERETVADSQAILERLRSAESLKLAALDHRMTQVVTEIDAIDRLLSKLQVGESSKEGPTEGKGVGHMLEVIQSYPELCASIDRIAHSSTREGRGGGSVGVNEVGVSAHDLRRETAERVEVLRRCDRYEEALGVKDQMLWALLQERNRVSGICSAEEGLRREYSEEVAHWVQLSTSLSGEVERLKEQLASVQGVRAENEALKRDKEALVAQLLQQGGGKGEKERSGFGKVFARGKEAQVDKE